MSSSYVGGLISREEKKRKGPPTLIDELMTGSRKDVAAVGFHFLFLFFRPQHLITGLLFSRAREEKEKKTGSLRKVSISYS